MSRSNEHDLAIARLSRRQHGVWSRRQALEEGMTPRMIHSRLQRGLWVPQDTAVFGHIAAEASWPRSVLAAVLAEPVAIATHRTAAVLHGLHGFRPGRPEITVPPGANARGRLAIVHRGVDVESTVVERIPVGTPAQTFVDLSQTCKERRVHEALERWVLDRPDDLDAVRDRYCTLAPRGGRNLRRLRRMLESFGAELLPTESELELHLHRAMDWPSIPPVEWQSPFPGRVPDGSRVDGLIRDWSVVVEGDGRAWHARTADFERDRRRDAEAAAAGLVTLRFTWRQLVHEVAWVRDVTIATGSHRAA
ncbi:MAG: hypothetical protein ACRDYW_12590 [Acidimicrobiales bacterium]